MMMIVFAGYKFGLLLQIAVGPICLFIFNTAVNSGFSNAFQGVIAVSLVDALFIILSGVGVSRIIQKGKIRTAIKLFGAAVLILYGLNIFLDAVWGYTLLPSVSLFSAENAKNSFQKCFLLTAANPLTIIFWSGVFSSQVAENNYSKNELVQFGLGCVLATFSFMVLVAFLGTILSEFLPATLITWLNIFAGIVLIYFGLRLLTKRDEVSLESN